MAVRARCLITIRLITIRLITIRLITIRLITIRLITIRPDALPRAHDPGGRSGVALP